MQDTIYALSSGAPPAGVAVIRISGNKVRFGLETLIGRIPEPRHAQLAVIRGADREILDRGLVLFFPGPASFTGEDVAELQIHGGRASVSSVLACLSDFPGYRVAEPGEFTRRSFENGRMDLTEVEGLSDLIRAETEAQRKQALRQADGGLRQQYEGWASMITHARAMIEAEFDFSDEDDIPGSVSDQIWPRMAELSSTISQHIAAARTGEIIRDGFRVALIGPPNAGKSSLLNALANRDAAIVSEIAGTTRDVVEVRMDIGGHLVLMQDTAGMRESNDPIEREGIRRSILAAQNADLVLMLNEPGAGSEQQPVPADIENKHIIVRTKSDLYGDGEIRSEADDGSLVVSSRTGAGIEALIGVIRARLEVEAGSSDDVLPSRERHVHYLKTCRMELENAVAGANMPVEIRAEHLRNAASALGRITGRVDVEDLLGVIFSEFCVGK